MENIESQDGDRLPPRSRSNVEPDEASGPDHFGMPEHHEHGENDDAHGDDEYDDEYDDDEYEDEDEDDDAGSGRVRPVTAAGTARPPRRLLRGSQQLQYLLGKRLLVGITIRDAAGAIVRRQQFCGPVTEVVDGVVVVEHDGGETLLPAEPDAYEPAQPGTYRLASGGEVVDPDFLSTWDVLPGGQGARSTRR